jgi:hypothetical protein
MRNRALSFGRNKNPVPLRRVLFYFVRVCEYMLDFWRNLIDAGLFAAEVQGVIALRLMRLAARRIGSKRRDPPRSRTSCCLPVFCYVG